jgi:hypothetical protein
MKVVDWISDAESADHEIAFGGMGGWFGFDQANTWQDYLDSWKPEVHPYIEAVRDSVIESGRWITGQQHQDDDDGTPLFEDGKVVALSFRAWGDLMAAIATYNDGKPHNYMEFYC